MLHWQQAAIALADENSQLRDLVKLVPQSAVSFVSARVIANSGGAFLRNLMIDAGTENGIARGQAAVVGEGLVGRVYEVGARAARILLITDLNSRVPVIVERSRQRAILAGDNSELPALWYLDPAAPLKVGDRIVTSGEGGIFPSGLPVGVVEAADSGSPRVQPFVRLGQLEYVRNRRLRSRSRIAASRDGIASRFSCCGGIRAQSQPALMINAVAHRHRSG